MRICISRVTLPHHYNLGNDLGLKKVAKITKRNRVSSLDFFSFLQEEFGMGGL